ncbi:hypothetical protein AAMO2058_001140300 [Amorphochlora amoebiformis]
MDSCDTPFRGKGLRAVRSCMLAAMTCFTLIVWPQGGARSVLKSQPRMKSFQTSERNRIWSGLFKSRPNSRQSSRSLGHNMPSGRHNAVFNPSRVHGASGGAEGRVDIRVVGGVRVRTLPVGGGTGEAGGEAGRVQIPTMVFGTRNLKKGTRDAVSRALSLGFVGVDSANYPPYFDEKELGSALGLTNHNTSSSESSDEQPPRRDIYVQTKFAPADLFEIGPVYSEHGMDRDRVLESFLKSEYDLSLRPAAEFAERFNISKSQPVIVDVLMLDVTGVRKQENDDMNRGLTQELEDSWKAMEEIVQSGRARALGVSATGRLPHRLLRQLHAKAKIKPAVVQGWCLAQDGYDIVTRRFCEETNMAYQAVSFIRGNEYLLEDSDIMAIAKKYNRSAAQVLIRFAIQSCIIPIVATPYPDRMVECLSCYSFELDQKELETVAQIARHYDYD